MFLVAFGSIQSCPVYMLKAFNAELHTGWSVTSRHQFTICPDVSQGVHVSPGARFVVTSMFPPPIRVNDCCGFFRRHRTITAAKGYSGTSDEGRTCDVGDHLLSGHRSSTVGELQDATPKHQRARRQQQQQSQGPQPQQPQPNARTGPSARREVGLGATYPARRSHDGSGAGIRAQPRRRGDDPSANPGRGGSDAAPLDAAAGGADRSTGSRRTSYPDSGRNPGSVDSNATGSYISEDVNGDGADNSFPGTHNGVNERRQRMVREAIEEALRTDGKLTGEAVVRTPYKPGRGGGKVAGKVTFLVSPIEVAEEVLEQAQRDAKELNRRTVHPALKEAQGRRFQSIDPLGLGSGFGRGSGAGGGGSSKGGAQARKEDHEGGAKGGGGKFLHDFRDDERQMGGAAGAGGGAASGAPRRYQFIEVRTRGGSKVSGDPESREPLPQVEPRAQPGPAPSPSSHHRQQQQQPRQQQSSLHPEQQSQSAAPLGAPRQVQPGSDLTSRTDGPREVQPLRLTSFPRQQHQPRRQQDEGHQLPQMQWWDAGGDDQQADRVEARQEEQEGGEESAPRQRYDYRLRLDPEKSVGGMARALLQALSGHLVVLSEVVGPDDLYTAVRVVATARTLLRQQQEKIAAGGDAAAMPCSSSGSGGGLKNKGEGGYSGASAAGRKPQQQYGTAWAKDEPRDCGDLALQILFPKQPYIKPRGYGRKAGSNDGRGEVMERVWRLYSHRVCPLGQGVEAPVRLCVNRTSSVKNLADKLGPAVLRDGVVILQAAGRDAVGVALEAVVRTRSWLASGSKAASTTAARQPCGQDEAPPQHTFSAAAPSAPSPVVINPPGADLDVAVYTSWSRADGADVDRGTDDEGDRGGPTWGGISGGQGDFRCLQLLVRLCRGSRPDLPVLGTDELLPPTLT
ncbi:hypothetical protein VaNZ11_012032 [Volvox africanus]|uniref:Uncharacterized protein n=1 Tax=Volvox africanus TaxID=51714 RepID=A0ABQ5SEL0_9CHLO|nr:hypothetical protein VaNZ11_012032 [Volvox africanus]